MRVRLVRLFVTVLIAPSCFHARRLPVKPYTTADGLARDRVECVVQDSRGFLWVCTVEGLSRFDGYQFTNYRTEQGLPGSYVSAFLKTRRGVYWVGTTAGLSRFDPTAAGATKFQRYMLPGDRSAQSVNVLGEDRHGTVWCGTHSGLFRLAKDGTSFEPVELDATAKGNGRIVNALLEARRGALWVSTGEGLYRREPEGRTISCGHLF